MPSIGTIVPRSPLTINVVDASKLIVHGIITGSQISVLDDWAAATAYVVGDKVKLPTSGIAVVCMVAGTSHAATEPTLTTGEDTDNTVTWRVLYSLKQRFHLVNKDSSNTIFLAFGVAAEDTKGIRLAPGEKYDSGFGHECYRGDIYAICDNAGGADVGIQEL